MQYVLSSYLTRLPHLQYRMQWKANEDVKVSNWIHGVTRFGLHGVIFHDCLSDAFVAKWQSDLVQFLHIDWKTPWNATEERFAIYRDWLREHEEVYWAVSTDLADVKFHKNPFEVIADASKIYIGSECCTVGTSPRHVVEAWMRCSFGEVTDSEKLLLNPGILGGHRDTLLPFLDRLFEEMSKGKPRSIGLDLTSVNRLIYRENIPFVTDRPLHTRFLRNEGPESGCAIKHK